MDVEFELENGCLQVEVAEFHQALHRGDDATVLQTAAEQLEAVAAGKGTRMFLSLITVRRETISPSSFGSSITLSVDFIYILTKDKSALVSRILRKKQQTKYATGHSLLELLRRLSNDACPFRTLRC